MPDRFVVPQFIDAEDKILGPITVRQFLICLGAAFVMFIEYTILTIAPFALMAALTAAIAAAFAFLKINGQPFHLVFVNVLQTMTRPNLRTWQKGYTDDELRAFVKSAQSAAPVMKEKKSVERPSSSRLRDLALTVNTGGVYNPEE